MNLIEQMMTSLSEGRYDNIQATRQRRQDAAQARKEQGSDESMLNAISRLSKSYLSTWGERLADDAMAVYELQDDPRPSAEAKRATQKLSKCPLIIASDPHSGLYEIGACSNKACALVNPEDVGGGALGADLYISLNDIGHWMFVTYNGDVFLCTDGSLGSSPSGYPDEYKIFDGFTGEPTELYWDFQASEYGEANNYFIEYYRALRSLIKNTTERNLEEIEAILDEFDEDAPQDTDDEFDLLKSESKKRRKKVKEAYGDEEFPELANKIRERPRYEVGDILRLDEGFGDDWGLPDKSVIMILKKEYEGVINGWHYWAKVLDSGEEIDFYGFEGNGYEEDGIYDDWEFVTNVNNLPKFESISRKKVNEAWAPEAPASDYMFDVWKVKNFSDRLKFLGTFETMEEASDYIDKVMAPDETSDDYGIFMTAVV